MRIRFEELAEQMNLGGLPVPAFIRDPKLRTEFWNNWVDTTLVRDVGRVFGKGYDPDYCHSLVRALAKALPNGDYPSLAYIQGNKRKARRYIQALENIFFLRRIPVHESGAGLDHWIFGDSGLALHLSPQKSGPEVSLAIARHYVLNEIFCFNEYQGFPLKLNYFKSARGSVVDLVWNGFPIKIIAQSISPTQMGYPARSVEGAMKALKVKRGVILAPTNSLSLPKTGICLLPWSYWS